MILGNNPIVMIDPNGADWYKNKKTGDIEYKGKWHGKHWGYKSLGKGNGDWLHYEGKDYNKKTGDVITTLKTVTVTGKTKSRNTLADRTFSWANFDRTEAKRWNSNLWDYKSLRNQGVSAEDAAANYEGLGATYERYYQAEQDWRAMNYLILDAVTIFVPVPKVGMSRWLFGSRYGRVLWTGGGVGGVAEKAAVKFASETFGTTLGHTNAGKIIIKLTGNTQNWLTGKIWDVASWFYARGAKGSIDAFIHLTPQTNARQVYWRIEKPVLERIGVTIFEHYR
jgi:hypothetical protein